MKMNVLSHATWRAAVLGRWMALIFGILMVLLFLAFFFGEGPPHFSALTVPEKLRLAAMGALFLGLAVAWKWEGLGGLICVAGFAALLTISPSHLKLWAFDAPAVIAAVHIACWWRLRPGPPTGLAPWRLPRNSLLGLGAALAILLLLCANEMFGQPPLMTPSLHPSANLLGVWGQTVPIDVLLTINPDGSVTGTIDGAAVERARISYGRSWFGRLLHWNADYVIRGRLSGRDFAAPLMTARRGLNGSLFRDNRPLRLNLRKPQA
jgi:hypothetical protein